MSDDGDQYEFEAELAGIVCGSISAFASLTVIGSYLFFPTLRSPSRMLLCFLAFSDFMQSMFFAIPVRSVSESVSCAIQSLFGIFAANTTFFWTACIAFFVMISVSHVEKPNSSDSARTRYLIASFHVICWGIPLIICITVFSMLGTKSGYNNDSSWCFIDVEYTVLRLVAILIPLFLCVLITLVCYFRAVYIIRRAAHHQHNQNQQQQQQPSGLRTSAMPSGSFTNAKSDHNLGASASARSEMRELSTKFILIPIIFIVLRLPELVYRIWQIIDDRFVANELDWMIPVLAVGNSVQGFCNALIFVVWTRKSRIAYAELFGRCFKCCRNSSHSHSTPDGGNARKEPLSEHTKLINST